MVCAAWEEDISNGQREVAYEKTLARWAWPTDSAPEWLESDWMDEEDLTPPPTPQWNPFCMIIRKIGLLKLRGDTCSQNLTAPP